MGTATYSAAAEGTFTLRGAGQADPAGQADAFHFTYKLWEGDGEIIAHRQAGGAADGRAQAGLIIREELSASARYAGVWLQPSGGDSAGGPVPVFQWRAAPGTPAMEAGASGGAGWTWLKLARHGNVFTAYGKSDAGAWTPLGSPQILPLSSRVYVGLAALSGSEALLTATFDHVGVTRADGGMGSPLAIIGSAASADAPDSSQTYDGQLSTSWRAEGNGQWVSYDLGTVKKITALSVSWFGGADPTGQPLQRIQAFDIQVTGTSALQWTTVFSGTSSGATHGEEVYAFMPTAARYVRIVGYGNSTGWETWINEVHVYGAALTEVPFDPAAVTASGSAAGRPANIRDDGLAAGLTWESPAGRGAWIQIPVDGATVGSLAVAWTAGNHSSTRFSVQLSADGATWQAALTGAVSTGLTRAPELYTLSTPATGVHYLRLVGEGDTATERAPHRRGANL